MSLRTTILNHKRFVHFIRNDDHSYSFHEPDFLDLMPRPRKPRVLKSTQIRNDVEQDPRVDRPEEFYENQSSEIESHYHRCAKYQERATELWHQTDGNWQEGTERLFEGLVDGIEVLDEKLENIVTKVIVDRVIAGFKQERVLQYCFVPAEQATIDMNLKDQF